MIRRLNTQEKKVVLPEMVDIKCRTDQLEQFAKAALSQSFRFAFALKRCDKVNRFPVLTMLFIQFVLIMACFTAFIKPQNIGNNNTSTEYRNKCTPFTSLEQLRDTREKSDISYTYVSHNEIASTV